MPGDNEGIGKELLAENGIECGRLSEDERERVCRMLTRDGARVRRMLRATVIAWALVVSFYIVFAFSHMHTTNPRVLHHPAVIVVFGGALWIAVFFTISFFVRWILFLIRSKSASIREIQATLGGIEEQLKKLSEKQ
jgi:hypothetical protein